MSDKFVQMNSDQILSAQVLVEFHAIKHTAPNICFKVGRFHERLTDYCAFKLSHDTHLLPRKTDTSVTEIANAVEERAQLLLGADLFRGELRHDRNFQGRRRLLGCFCPNAAESRLHRAEVSHEPLLRSLKDVATAL